MAVSDREAGPTYVVEDEARAPVTTDAAVARRANRWITWVLLGVLVIGLAVLAGAAWSASQSGVGPGSTQVDTSGTSSGGSGQSGATGSAGGPASQTGSGASGATTGTSGGATGASGSSSGATGGTTGGTTSGGATGSGATTGTAPGTGGR